MKIFLTGLTVFIFSFFTYLVLFIEVPRKAMVLNCSFHNGVSYYGKVWTKNSCELMYDFKYYKKDYEIRVNGGDQYRSTIKYLSISEADVEFLPEKIFEKFKNLEILEISNTTLEIIDESTFAGGINLKTLNLRNNKIKYLDNSAFKNLKHLKYLNLEGNQLEYLNKKLFINNNQLESLVLTNNDINFIDEDLFSGLKKLKSLDLSGNLCSQKSFPPAEISSLNLELKECFENARNSEKLLEVLETQEKSYQETLKTFHEESSNNENVSNEFESLIYLKFFYVFSFIVYVTKSFWDKLLWSQSVKNKTRKGKKN
jgi:hypothetical protein